MSMHSFFTTVFLTAFVTWAQAQHTTAHQSDWWGVHLDSADMDNTVLAFSNPMHRNPMNRQPHKNQEGNTPEKIHGPSQPKHMRGAQPSALGSQAGAAQPALQQFTPAITAAAVAPGLAAVAALGGGDAPWSDRLRAWINIRGRTAAAAAAVAPVEAITSVEADEDAAAAPEADDIVPSTDESDQVQAEVVQPEYAQNHLQELQERMAHFTQDSAERMAHFTQDSAERMAHFTQEQWCKLRGMYHRLPNRFRNVRFDNIPDTYYAAAAGVAASALFGVFSSDTSSTQASAGSAARMTETLHSCGWRLNDLRSTMRGPIRLSDDNPSRKEDVKEILSKAPASRRHDLTPRKVVASVDLTRELLSAVGRRP
eukprot:gnl/TRDRNA2_/TRDRNA2_39460_c0_seq1.p1 gnl/TRDRNA2_/TRDRNA2_39460_c0~~gnl/TRDRNA2_/TRDRNA2_39460_c0_seq1.p1  ORF type:complete len:369 (+),score=54.00 gnl/TRDRNA2_/TRDRNA2_39460_c0_seq1:109-1215(+)